MSDVKPFEGIPTGYFLIGDTEKSMLTGNRFFFLSASRPFLFPIESGEKNPLDKAKEEK